MTAIIAIAAPLVLWFAAARVGTDSRVGRDWEWDAVPERVGAGRVGSGRVGSGR